MRRTALLIVFSSIMMTSTGCMAIAESLIGGLFDREKESQGQSMLRKERERDNQRRWKSFWRENPTVNPPMTDAFKDDYE